MFLKQLIIRANGEIVRDVNFKVGLNLVIDYTSIASKDSGNNVGKTTLLRVIDYCLGGEDFSIYRDGEFKGKTNTTVQKFLIDGNVSFELFTSDINGEELVLTRQVGKNPLINGKSFKIMEFRLQLNIRLFGYAGASPSFRQLIGKFIRIDERQMTNTIFFLHPSTSLKEYENIYMFLFGIHEADIFDSLKALKNKLKTLEKQRLALGGIIRSSSSKQVVATLDRNISKVSQQLADLDFFSKNAEDVEKLSDLRAQIVQLNLMISAIKTRIKGNRNTVADLKSTESAVNPSVIAALYRQVGVVVPAISKSFSEVVHFHNKMLVNKIDFVNGLTLKWETELVQLQNRLDMLLELERSLIGQVSSLKEFADVQRIQDELNNLKLERGRAAALTRELERVSDLLKETKSSIEEQKNKLMMFKDIIADNLSVFNSFFAEYSHLMYGDEYQFLMNLNENEGFSLMIDQIEANEGAGKKKAQVVAFDLAYLKWLYIDDARTVRFVIHDKLESIASNQLGTIFNIADQLEGQYIVSILRDRIPDLSDEFISRNTILTLSQHDKLFKI